MIHGYNDPKPGATCRIGTPPDHCLNQQFGLDIQPIDSTLEILAPASGTLSWIDDQPHADGSPPSQCLGMAVGGLNLNICHFGSYNGVVKTGDTFHQGQVVERGCILGLRDTSWIHLSLDDRRVTPYAPVPFTGATSLEGVDYPAKDLSIADQ